MRSVVLVVALAFGWAPTVADAATPTRAEASVSNRMAAEHVAREAPSSSPRTEPRPSPDTKAGAAPIIRAPNGIVAIDDPRLEGVAGNHANDPSYVAAYRACMRQKGF